MLEIYKIVGKDVSNFENNRLKDEKISKSKIEVEKLRKELKLYIEEKMYDDEKKCFVRNPEDKKMDISIKFISYFLLFFFLFIFFKNIFIFFKCVIYLFRLFF